MTMRVTLLEHLRCPECRGPLEPEVAERDGEHVMMGRLACRAGCGHWPITRGVPRFVPQALAADVKRTARNFGASWKIWSGVDDDRYDRQLAEWLPGVDLAAVAGRTLLDAGCGKGRHLRLMAARGARAVVGVDLSDAVDVAFDNTRHLPQAHVIQADLLRPPLAGGFDLAYSIGVLHHTPDPAAAFAAVAGQVRPGGIAAFWVYGRENNGWIIWLVNPLRLAITRHLPTWAVRGIAWALAVVLYALILVLYAPARRLGARPFYAAYMHNLQRLGFSETRHIVYDHLIAPTAHYLRRDEVARWLDGLEDASVTAVNDNSWSGLGRRPRPASAARAA